jgi:hypothetical protein
MTKPPVQKHIQKDYVQSAVRLPRSLRQELKDAAERNGRTMNAEILARLQASPLDEIKQQNEELKKMLRQVLDRLPG